MIWKKHGERLIGDSLIIINTHQQNEGDIFLTNRISGYKNDGYKVKVTFFNDSYEIKNSIIY